MVISNYTKAVAVSESDSATFAATDAVYIGDPGTNATFTMYDGVDVQFTFLADAPPQLLPIRVKAFKATGSDATGVIALYVQ